MSTKSASDQPSGYPQPLTKPNDGITHYFDSYILSGEKGQGKHIKEFDLIPTDGCECITEAHRLRAERITIFKNANTLLEKIVADIASEIDGQTIHLSSLITRGELRATNEAKFKGALSFLAILELASVATSTANLIIGENYTSASLYTYNSLQGTSLGVNIVSSILYYLGHLAKEASRARVVRIAQENLIVNLPFEKISTIHLTHSPSNTSNDKYTVYERPYNGVELRSNWLKDQYTGLSFKLNDSDEELMITKKEYVTRSYLQAHIIETGKFKEDKLEPFAKDVHRYMYDAAPNMLAVLTMANIGLVIATLVNVSEQASLAKHLTSPGNTTESSTQAPTQFTVTTPNTANASIAFTVATALLAIIHSSDSPVRVCEIEMSKTLKAISRTYDNNQGRMSEELSGLLQDFGVVSAFSDALTITPQLENIQRSIFKARQELREHIEALELDLRTRTYAVETEERELLERLWEIEKMVDISKMETLHAQDRTSLRGLTGQAGKVVELVDEKVSKKKPGERKLSGAFLSRRLSIVGVSKRLSGFLGFSAAVTNKAVVKDATVPVEAAEETEPPASRPQSGM